MKLRSFLVQLAIGTAAIAAPANATTLMFDFVGGGLTGPVTASFQLDSNAIPDRVNDQSVFGLGQIFFENVAGIINGSAETASISFGTGLASQFQIQSASSGFAQFGGDEVFTGPLTAPVFAPGTFTFRGFSRGTLTVTQVAAAVPEPATWAMLILGFTMTGLAMRNRRRQVVKVSYA